MFQNCGLKQTPRVASTVPVQVDITPGYLGDQNTGGFYWAVKTTLFTVGTCVVTPLVSYDNGVTYTTLGSSYAKTISGNGITYVALEGPVPAYIGLRLTPAGGFEASSARCEVRSYTSGKFGFLGVT